MRSNIITMNKSKTIGATLLLNQTFRIVYSSSFCTNPDDYECKHLGITKFIPKSKRSSTEKPLPIEKPKCVAQCLETDFWCEERSACIALDEHCDCGPNKIYCTSKDAYSCESRKGILQSNIFNICQNGDCKKNCSMPKQEEETEQCGETKFRCGGRCLPKTEIVKFRSCNKRCLSVHKTCTRKQREGVTNNLKIDLSMVVVALTLIFILGGCLLTIVRFHTLQN